MELRKSHALYCLISLFLCYSCTLFALDKNTRDWNSLIVQGSFNKTKWLYWLSTEARYNIDPDGLDVWQLRSQLGYELFPDFKLWLGYQWDSSSTLLRRPQGERIWQQVQWVFVKLERFRIESRSRMEERWLSGQSQQNVRIREQIRVEIPKVIPQFTPVIRNELFVNLNNPEWVTPNTLDQNRAFIGINFPLFKQGIMEVGYLNQYLFNRINQRNNVLFIGLTVNVDKEKNS